MVSANRVAAINPPIDDTDPIRNFSIDLGSHTDWQNPAEFSPKGGRYGISVSTPHRRYGHRLRTPFLRTPFPRLLVTDFSCLRRNYGSLIPTSYVIVGVLGHTSGWNSEFKTTTFTDGGDSNSFELDR